MKELNLLYYNIGEVADYIGKSINFLWHSAAEGELKLETWYQGYCFEPNYELQEWIKRCNEEERRPAATYFNQYVGLRPIDALEFNSVIIDNKERKTAIASAIDTICGFKPTMIRIARDSVVISAEEKKRLGAEFHKPIGKKAESIKNNNMNIFLPSERKSLIKIVYAIAVDVYGYDPYNKKSPIPHQFIEDLAMVGIFIDEEIICGWLEEGHRLREFDIEMKDIDPSEKEDLIKVVYAMAIVGYGYDPEEKKSPTPTKIVNAVTAVDMSIEADTVRKWLNEGKKYQKKEQ